MTNLFKMNIIKKTFLASAAFLILFSLIFFNASYVSAVVDCSAPEHLNHDCQMPNGRFGRCTADPLNANDLDCVPLGLGSPGTSETEGSLLPVSPNSISLLPGDTGAPPPGDTGGDTNYELPNPLEAETFEEVVGDIAAWVYLIAIPLATLMILYAAALFMTSGGDEEKIKRAKRALTWAIVGVGIVVIGSGFIALIKDILQAY